MSSDNDVPLKVTGDVNISHPLTTLHASKDAGLRTTVQKTTNDCQRHVCHQ